MIAFGKEATQNWAAQGIYVEKLLNGLREVSFRAGTAAQTGTGNQIIAKTSEVKAKTHRPDDPGKGFVLRDQALGINTLDLKDDTKTREKVQKDIAKANKDVEKQIEKLGSSYLHMSLSSVLRKSDHNDFTRSFDSKTGELTITLKEEAKEKKYPRALIAYVVKLPTTKQYIYQEVARKKLEELCSRNDIVLDAKNWSEIINSVGEFSKNSQDSWEIPQTIKNNQNVNLAKVVNELTNFVNGEVEKIYDGIRTLKQGEDDEYVKHIKGKLEIGSDSMRPNVRAVAQKESSMIDARDSGLGIAGSDYAFLLNMEAATCEVSMQTPEGIKPVEVVGRYQDGQFRAMSGDQDVYDMSMKVLLKSELERAIFPGISQQDKDKLLKMDFFYGHYPFDNMRGKKEALDYLTLLKQYAPAIYEKIGATQADNISSPTPNIKIREALDAAIANSQDNRVSSICDKVKKAINSKSRLDALVMLSEASLELAQVTGSELQSPTLVQLKKVVDDTFNDLGRPFGVNLTLNDSGMYFLQAGLINKDMYNEFGEKLEQTGNRGYLHGYNDAIQHAGETENADAEVFGAAEGVAIVRKNNDDQVPVPYHVEKHAELVALEEVLLQRDPARVMDYMRSVSPNLTVNYWDTEKNPSDLQFAFESMRMIDAQVTAFATHILRDKLRTICRECVGDQNTAEMFYNHLVTGKSIDGDAFNTVNREKLSEAMSTAGLGTISDFRKQESGLAKNLKQAIETSETSNVTEIKKMQELFEGEIASVRKQFDRTRILNRKDGTRLDQIAFLIRHSNPDKFTPELRTVFEDMPKPKQELLLKLYLVESHGVKEGDTSVDISRDGLDSNEQKLLDVLNRITVKDPCRIAVNMLDIKESLHKWGKGHTPGSRYSNDSIQYEEAMRAADESVKKFRDEVGKGLTVAIGEDVEVEQFQAAASHIEVSTGGETYRRPPGSSASERSTLAASQRSSASEGSTLAASQRSSASEGSTLAASKSPRFPFLRVIMSLLSKLPYLSRLENYFAKNSSVGSTLAESQRFSASEGSTLAESQRSSVSEGSTLAESQRSSVSEGSTLAESQRFYGQESMIKRPVHLADLHALTREHVNLDDLKAMGDLTEVSSSSSSSSRTAAASFITLRENLSQKTKDTSTRDRVPSHRRAIHPRIAEQMAKFEQKTKEFESEAKKAESAAAVHVSPGASAPELKGINTSSSLK